ncbi:MAG: glucose-6-phosphate isomerase, partial [Pseudobdellovibrio sp.]
LSAIESELNEYTKVPQSLIDFKNSHKKFFIVGIGGSSLGIQVLADVYQIKNFEFIDNVDAAHFEYTLNSITNLEEVAWLFISKSGRSIETLAALDFISQFLSEKSVDLQKHTIVITEKKESDLYNWAVENKVLNFSVPLDVGGRFSVLSSVGLVPAILMGLDIQKIQKGALSVYQEQSALVTFTETTLKSFERGEWVSVLWSYSSRLKSLGFWWQQLWAESLAKKVDRQGGVAPRVSTPMPMVGATDQHSTLQQIMEGARDKMVFFLRTVDAEKGLTTLKKSLTKETSLLQGKTLGTLLKAEAEAIQLALSEVGVSNITLQVSDLKEENLGRLIMFFQISVMALSEALNINAFDQPGVELGKVMTKKILSES